MFKRLCRDASSSLRVLCVSGLALSLSSNEALAENVGPDGPAESVVDTAGLTTSKKAGARGNLTGLFKSPKHVTSIDGSHAPGELEETVASLDASPSETGPLANGHDMRMTQKKQRADALSALIAANAGPEALQNADPNSRLGKIAAYRVKILEVELLKSDLAEAKKVLSALELPTATIEELTGQLALEAAAKTKLQIEAAQIRTGLNAVGGVNAELETDLTAVLGALAHRNKALLEVAADKNAAEMFDRTMKLVQMAEGDLSRAKVEASELLGAASNTPISGELIAEVHRLLDLPVFE